jgi:hypothetical protein
MSLLEDALAEGFKFHDGLDSFLKRTGIPQARINSARERAEQRSKASPRNFSRAPKRFVAQEILSELGSGSDNDDRLLANLVTALSKTKLPDATSTAKAAIAALADETKTERREAEARKEELRSQKREEERERQQTAGEKAQAREKFRDDFFQLTQQSSPQTRGYMLEKFLNAFLAFEGLNPRGSFKLVGEQIDGSFQWASRTYLVETKWVADPVGGAGFAGLMYKIEGKTADTRGLFISINGYSPEAIKGLHQKGELRFVCIDGAHLVRCLEPGGSLPRLLETIWRHASETGDAYVPVSLMFDK